MSRHISNELRNILAAATGPSKVVAAQYGVCQSTVLRARRYKGKYRRAGGNIPQADIDLMRKLRKKGATYAEISSQTGYCDSFIWKKVRDIPRVRGWKNAEHRAKAIELRKSGMKLKEIAKQVPFSEPVIWGWCEDARVNPPPKKRPCLVRISA